MKTFPSEISICHGVLLYRIISVQQDKCATGCSKFIRLLSLIFSAGLSEGRQLFISLLHITHTDVNSCFYNGLAAAFGKLAQLQTDSFLVKDKMSL